MCYYVGKSSRGAKISEEQNPFVPSSIGRRLHALCRKETGHRIGHRLECRRWYRDAEAEGTMVSPIPSSSMVRGCGESVSGDTPVDLPPAAIPFRRIRQECSPAHGAINSLQQGGMEP